MIFLLHEVKGFEHKEIAKLLRCSVGNSKSQLHKAKLRMRKLLTRQRAVHQTERANANPEAARKLTSARRIKRSALRPRPDLAGVSCQEHISQVPLTSRFLPVASAPALT
jgi:hypothetical protein